MKKVLSFLLSIALTAACVPFSLPSSAAEDWDVTFTVNVAGYETQPGSTKVVVFTNDSDTERVIRTNVYDFSCRVFIFNAEGRLIEAGENLLPGEYSCQNALVIPAHGFMAAFGTQAYTTLNTAYTTVFEGAVLYNSTMSIICEAYGELDKTNNKLTIRYNRPAPESENAVSFLFVGNSSTYFNGTPIKFKAVCAAAGIEVSVTYCTFGSAYLSEFADENHERGQALRAKLNARSYDYVVLQEASSDSYSGMKAALDVILPLVEANGAQPLLYLRYSDTTAGCIRHYQIYDRISKHYGGIPYSPVAVAFEYCRTDHPEINLYASDGGHHSKAGSLIAAYTWLYTFFGVSPVGNGYLADMPAATARILQEYAAKAVEVPFEAGAVPADEFVADGVAYRNMALDRPYVPTGSAYDGKWTDTGDNGKPIGKFTDGDVTTEGDSTNCGCYKGKTTYVTVDLGKTCYLKRLDTDLFGGTWGIPDPDKAEVSFEISVDGENFVSAGASSRTAADTSYKNWSRVVFYNEPETHLTARYVRVKYVLDPEATNTFCWISEIRAFGCVRGDFTGDENADSTDAIYLLRHVLFGDDYPLNQSGDFTGEGECGSNDAIYLLRHVLFGDDYPLN